jgi:hypothetical protein
MDWVQSGVTFLSGATAMGGVAHAVNTFPTPDNKYGAWFLGVVQWVVGQRVVANNTLQGLQTVARGVTTSEKDQGAK